MKKVILFSKKPSENLGEEIIVNGDFATDTNWTKQNNWQISGGNANTSAPLTASSWLFQSYSVYAGEKYRVTLDTVVNAGSFLFGFQGNFTPTISATGSYSFDVDVLSNGTFLGPRGNTGFDGSIDNISVKEIL